MKKFNLLVGVGLAIILHSGCGPKEIRLPSEVRVIEDYDKDGVPDGLDNCPLVSNVDQGDADGDGIGDVCDKPDQLRDDDGDGFTVAEGDCNDADAAVHPGAAELCDAKDNDCDHVVDEGCPAQDADHDGFTVAEGDCNDADAAVHPGAAEVCDAKDNDCDGVTDEGCQQQPVCGDGVCNGSETCVSCQADCGTCGGVWHLTGYDCTGGDGSQGDWDDEVGRDQRVYAWFTAVAIGECFINQIASGNIYGVNTFGSTFAVQAEKVECPLGTTKANPAACNGPGWVVIAPK